MKRAFPNLALCLVLGCVTQHAGAAPSPADAVSASPRSAASVTVHSVTPDSFSAFNGELNAVVSGDTSGPPQPVNLFAYGPLGGKRKLSPRKMTVGRFNVTTSMGVNSLINNGVMTFFVSPSEDGTHEPSAPFSFGPNIVLPAPAITSAVGGRRRVTVNGTSLRNAHLRVTLAGTSQDIVANSGGWHVVFEGVAEGSHQVSAKVVDSTGAFPDSAAAFADVVTEGDIIRPLHVIGPPPGVQVNRRFTVSGVASPDRGNVLVSLGGARAVEASVGPRNHHWSAQVTSPTHGATPLFVQLPGTGESVSYDVNIAPFGDPVVSRFVRQARSRENGGAQLIAEGTVSLDGSDTVVRYLNRDKVWQSLAPIDEEARWRYAGDYPIDIQVQPGTIDGLAYPEVARLNVPSLGDGHGDDAYVSVPLLKAAPELTSPLRVGTQAVLSGLDYNGPARAVNITLADGQIFQATVGLDQRWSTVIGPLPIGRSVITLSKDFPGNVAHLFETSTYVLDVVETP